MAISLVGTVKSGDNRNGGDVTLTFDGSPAQGDVVFLVGGHGEQDGTAAIGPSNAGYTQVAVRRGTVSMDAGAGIWYKVMGATPDASVTGQGGGAAKGAVAYMSIVLRGVDTTTPIDVTTTEAGPTTSASIDPPSITTATDGAWVMPVAFHEHVANFTVFPSGYSNATSAKGADTYRIVVGLATKAIATAGTEDPGAFSAAGASQTWYAFTVAIRPAGSAITGSLSETEANDTLSASGTHTPPAFTGTLAETEADDTLAASGTHTAPQFTGSLAETEELDTLSASGTFTPQAITGTLAVTEADDTLAATGTGGVEIDLTITVSPPRSVWSVAAPHEVWSVSSPRRT